MFFTSGPNKLSCLDHDFLRIPAQIDGAAFIAAAVASRCAIAGHKMLFSVAPGARHLPLLIAAIGILGDTVRDGVLKQVARAGTLVVDSDLDLRAKYSTLQIA